MRFASIKTQLIIFLIGFALFMAVKDKDTAFLFATLITVVSVTLFDSLALYLKNKKLTLSDSVIISGLIIGFVLASDQPRWVFILAALFAVSSKYLLRIKKKHLFNPATFGILSTIILMGAQTQWKGTYLWYILVPAGLYFSAKVKKLEVIWGYFLAALVLFGAQALMRKAPLLNIFGYLSYFYIFIMVIEPKTTPIRPLGKFIFGIGVAILVFILTEAGVRFDAELAALLTMNLSVPLLNKIPERRA